MKWGRASVVAAAATLALVIFPCVMSDLLQKLVYTEKLNGEMYDGLVRSEHHLVVVYFFKSENPIMVSFLKEMEKSAAIMAIYEVKFGIVDCATHPGVGHCDDKESEEQVYMYRNGHMVLHVSVHSMFSVDSIISNVLQVVLLHKVPILQTIEEKEKFISDNRGGSDVIFSYQMALGTYSHRILMEVIFVYQNSYSFAVSNEPKTVADLPYYHPDESSGIWLFRCKSVRSPDQPCPAYKFRGQMWRTVLSRFFRALELPVAHDAGQDGDFDPYQESDINILYIFYDDEKSEAATKALIEEFNSNYLGLMGITTVNVNTADMTKYEFQRNRKLPLLAFRRTEATVIENAKENEMPTSFLERMLNLPKVNANSKKPSDNKNEDSQEELDLESEMEKQDDAVAKAAFDLRRVPFDRSHLPALTDKSFFSQVQERPFLMVLFYLNFDARNQIAVRLFAKAAEVLAADDQFPLAAVECFDWTDVCGKVNISVYPTVLIYQANMEPALYNGPLSVGSFVTAAELYTIEAPVVLSTAGDVSLFGDGDLPDKVKLHTNVAVVGAFGNQHLKYDNAFKMAAKQLQGRHLCGIVRDDIAESTCKSHGFKTPCIIAFKRHDQLEPHKSVKPDDSVEKLIENIELAVLPLLPELTTENFPTYWAMKKPFVILFTTNVDSSYFRAMSSVATEGHTLDLVLGWMNVSSTSSGKPSLGEQILRHHVKEPNPEEILAIKHENGQVYRFSESEASSGTISIWLNRIVKGDIKISTRLSENEWKPRLPAYNFLKKMDDDAARMANEDTKITPYIRQLNEDGLESGEEHFSDAMGDELDLKMEHEIRLELDELKHSRLYQTPRAAKSTSRPNPTPSESEEGRLKHTVHGEL